MSALVTTYPHDQWKSERPLQNGKPMQHEETAICVVDDAGEILREG
jgi:hypothetical protein